MRLGIITGRAITIAKNLPTQVLFLELELKIETLVTKLKLVVT